MESSVRPRVRRQCLPVLVQLSTATKIGLDRLSETVVVDEVISSVVRRIDVDHLHAPSIALLQQLEHFQVVALDEQVTRILLVHSIARDWRESALARRRGYASRVALAGPRESEMLGFVAGVF